MAEVSPRVKALRLMQRTNAANEAEANMSANAPAVPVSTRSVDEINAEIARERAEFNQLLKENDAYQDQRRIKLLRREKLEAAWKAQNPGVPFDAESFIPPAYVPSADSPVQGKFHAKHYTLARLEQELMVARKRDTGLI